MLQVKYMIFFFPNVIKLDIEMEKKISTNSPKGYYNIFIYIDTLLQIFLELSGGKKRMIIFLELVRTYIYVCVCIYMTINHIYPEKLAGYDAPCTFLVKRQSELTIQTMHDACNYTS